MAVYLTVFLALFNQTSLKGSKMLVALYAIELGASPFDIGMLISMYAIFPLMLAVVAGRVSDRFGVRLPMMAGSFGMFAGLLLPTLFPGMAALFVSAAMLGLANIFFHVSSQHLIGALSNPETRTSNFGTFSVGASMSGIIGPVLVGFMVDHGGYIPSYYALCAIVIVPGIFLCFKHGFIPAKIVHKESSAGKKASDLLSIRPLRNAMLTSGLVLTGIDLFNFYMPIHGRSIGLTASVIGIIIGMQAVAALTVRLLMPWMVKHQGEMRVMTWSLLVSGMTYFLYPLFVNPVLLAAISFILGLGLGCGQPLSIIMTYHFSPPGRSGEALGMRITVNKFTQILVPLVFGSIGGAFGVYPIFWSTAVLLVAGGANNARLEKATH